MSLLRLHQQIALCIPDGFALRREQCHCIFAGQMLGGFFQRGGFLGGKPDGVMVIKDADACAEGQCAAGKCGEITLDALCCFQHSVPCAHKEHIIAAGIDDAYLQPFENAVDVALEKQRHLPGERRGAGQGNIVHPFDRVFLVFLLETGDKCVPEVVHIHTADCNAAHALGLLCQFFHAVAGGVIANIQVGAVSKAGERCIFGVYTRDRFTGSQPFAGRELIRQGQIFAAAVQCRQRAVIGSRGLTAYYQNALVLDLDRKIYKQFTPRAEIILQVGTGAAHLAFPAIRVSGGAVQQPQIFGGVAVEFVLLQQTVHPAEQLFVEAFFSRGIGQVVAGAGRPCVDQKQLGAELLLQPAVELPVPPGQGIGHSGSVGQQHIAVPAAAVNQVGAGHAAPGQKLVQIVLHEQLQKERPAAQGAQGVFGMDGIKELLDAGKISGIEQKNVLPAKILLLLKKRLAQVGDVVCLHIFADARRNGCGGLGVVKQGNIRAFAGKGAGRKTAELRFQQTQQRVDPLRLRLQIRQALAQLAHGICIDGSGKRLLLPWQLQTAVLRLRRHHPAGVGTVQVGEHRVQRKIPPEGTAFAFDLPAVCGGRKIIC